jgi:hypothetical protein
MSNNTRHGGLRVSFGIGLIVFVVGFAIQVALLFVTAPTATAWVTLGITAFVAAFFAYEFAKYSHK